MPGCRCKHKFSDSNTLTASTDVLPEELHWPVYILETGLVQNAPSATLTPALWMLSSWRRSAFDAVPYTIHP